MPNTLCLFSSYFEHTSIPDYIRFYLLELRKHSRELWLLSNEKVLSADSQQFLAQNNIRLLLLPNKGYDFGQWYAALQQIDLLQFDRLILANDSCILFRSLDNVVQWFESSSLDYAGITDSLEDSYHIQSYFLMAGKKALPHIAYYFRINGIAEGMGKRRRKVIETYEIGLSQYLLSQNLSIGAMIRYEQSGLVPPRYNMALHMTGKLPLLGVPMIKRRFLTGAFGKEELLNFIYDTDFYLPSDLKRRITYFCRSISIMPPDWVLLTGKRAQTTLEERLQFARQLAQTHPSCIYNWIHLKDFITGWLALWRLFWLKKEPILLWDGLYWSFQRVKLIIDALS
ncbi:rhamnan synthesis F family protein [Rhodoflexus caldus]|uniref:rhamnan synthesis F family protein n=1 Tax=Rhodoflexus caldus TaxID=2891236 RepID=UPI00202A01EF|nr:rhamnan synthesis F family protein [Rhodoflexus caldus]